MVKIRCDLCRNMITTRAIIRHERRHFCKEKCRDGWIEFQNRRCEPVQLELQLVQVAR